MFPRRDCINTYVDSFLGSRGVGTQGFFSLNTTNDSWSFTCTRPDGELGFHGGIRRIHSHPVHETTSYASVFEYSGARLFGCSPRSRGVGATDLGHHEATSRGMSTLPVHCIGVGVDCDVHVE